MPELSLLTVSHLNEIFGVSPTEHVKINKAEFCILCSISQCLSLVLLNNFGLNTAVVKYMFSSEVLIAYLVLHKKHSKGGEQGKIHNSCASMILPKRKTVLKCSLVLPR